MNRATMREAVIPFLAEIDTGKAVRSVRTFLDSGTLEFDNSDTASYNNGQIWSGEHPRSFQRKAHGWFFLRYWANAWEELGSSEKRLLSQRLERLLTTWSALKESSPMAYHDETTAQRVINFAQLVDFAGGELPENISSCITELIQEEVGLLVSDEFYAGSNNHGMFQNIAILVATALGPSEVGPESAHAIATARLVEYLTRSFTPDGVHRENNPTYHVMVSRFLNAVQRYFRAMGRRDLEDKFEDIFEGADRYAAFALTPANNFVPISDTKRGPVNRANIVQSLGKGLALGALTYGKESHPPSSSTYVSTVGSAARSGDNRAA